MSNAEPVASPVVGFRSWRIDGSGRLVPVFYATFRNQLLTTWINREGAIAYCEKGAQSPCSSRTCTCGLYAWKRPKDYSKKKRHYYGGDISGAIVAWGEIEEHKVGFRAQYAKPIAFASIELNENPQLSLKLNKCLEYYDIPMLDFPEMYEYSQWFGDLLELKDEDRHLGEQDPGGGPWVI